MNVNTHIHLVFFDCFFEAAARAIKGRPTMFQQIHTCTLTSMYFHYESFSPTALRWGFNLKNSCTELFRLAMFPITFAT